MVSEVWAEGIAKHLALLGVNHKVATVSMREILASEEFRPEKLLEPLIHSCKLDEACILSTCNRFEVVASGDRALWKVKEFLESRMAHVRGAKDLPQVWYYYEGKEAVRHLFRVASSLDSLVLGEVQILNQVKEAYQLALGQGYTKKLLNHLFQFTFGLAKEIRSETGIAARGISTSYVAVQLAEQICGELSQTHALILGSGEIAELVAIHLQAQGCRHITIANRTFERAISLAERVGGSALRLDEALRQVHEADIVVGSLTVEKPFLKKSDFLSSRRSKPLFLIDLGMPRNFEAEIGDLDEYYLYNIDDLGNVVENNKSLRQEAARSAEVFIEYGIGRFEQWLKKVASEPALLQLRMRLQERTREALKGKIAASSVEEEERTLDELTHRITQEVNHLLTELLTESGQGVIEAHRLVPLFFEELLKQ